MRIEGLRRHQSQVGDETQIILGDGLPHTAAALACRGSYVDLWGFLLLSSTLKRMQIRQANGDHTDGPGESMIADGPDL